ncbi:MAG: hypothetical protein ABI846_15970 [Rudaea sp.]
MKTNALLCTALAAVSLGACVETRFESPPGDNIETCDARWKGLWLGDDEKPKDSNTAIFVDEGCRFTVLDQPERGGPFKEVHVAVNFVHTDGKDYLVVADAALKGLVKVNPVYGIEPMPERSFFIDRYVVRGDHIDLFAVDDQLAARKVIEGKLEGSVSKTPSELHVFIRGDRARVLQILRRDTIFNAKPQLRLGKVKQSVAEFEQAAIAAQKKAKP